jgi:pyruvate dehydrogenase E2 component (dihydrolipoamide acetyltransferase)
MATTVIMPKFGMTQEKGTIVEWRVAEGATVQQGDLLLTVETDKVAMDVEAPSAGILSGVRYGAGAEVPVTEVIAYLLAPGEHIPSTPESSGAVSVVVENDQSGLAVSPLARRMAEEAGVSLEAIAATLGGEARRLGKADVEAYFARQSATGDLRATPAARRLAKENQVTLAEIAGSGPKGRIQARDVLAEAGRHEQLQPSAAPWMQAAASLPPAPGGVQPVSTGTAYEAILLKGMRRTIAQRMTQNYLNPHILFTMEADMTRAIDLQQRAQRSLGSSGKVSLTAVLLKVVAWALGQHRWLNAHLVGDEVRFFTDANIGVAVALDEGLIVPVVKRAQTKSVREIALEINDLAARARNSTLLPDDVTGGTFTVSNLGMLEVDHFTAILNSPETGILSVGRVVRKFVPDENDQPVVRPLMTMTVGVDHRAVDGAVAARFLRDVKHGLEDPLLLMA